MSRKASVARRTIKRAKKQARKDKRLAVLVAIRMVHKGIPHFLSGRPTHELEYFLKHGQRYDRYYLSTQGSHA